MEQETLEKNENANADGGDSEVNAPQEKSETSSNGVKQSDSTDVQSRCRLVVWRYFTLWLCLQSLPVFYFISPTRCIFQFIVTSQ